jgi:hypothetical protein
MYLLYIHFIQCSKVLGLEFLYALFVYRSGVLTFDL